MNSSHRAFIVLACSSRTTDLIFILDGSGSVNWNSFLNRHEDNFALVLEWMLNVTKGFFIDRRHFIGVIQYSKQTVVDGEQ